MSSEKTNAIILVDETRWQSFLNVGVKFSFQFCIPDPLAFAHEARIFLLNHEPNGVDIDLSIGHLEYEKTATRRADNKESASSQSRRRRWRIWSFSGPLRVGRAILSISRACSTRPERRDLVLADVIGILVLGFSLALELDWKVPLGFLLLGIIVHEMFLHSNILFEQSVF